MVFEFPVAESTTGTAPDSQNISSGRKKASRKKAPEGSHRRFLLRVTPEFGAVERAVHDRRLHTVCSSAACPNLGEWLGAGHGHAHDGREPAHAALRVLRRHHGRPALLDPGEPERVAEAVAALVSASPS